MSAYELFNPVYEKVRELGLAYQIKESGNSVIIKISSNNEHHIKQEKEKFRFHTTRTLNGSNNPNWRSPQNFYEKSLIRNSCFPNFSFFQTTPPPQYKTPPSALWCPATACSRVKPVSTPPPPISSASPTFVESIPSAVSSDTSTSLESPNQTFQKPNPYRSTRRQITFPRTPNLINPF